MPSEQDKKPKDRVPIGILVFTIGIFFATLAGLGVFGSGKGKATTSTSTPTPNPLTTTTNPQPPESPFLRLRTPSGGDTPTGGYIKLAGRAYPNSIFYEKVGDAESPASACKSEPFACRATSYELHGKYHVLITTFGIAESGEYTPEAKWKVLVDGSVAKEGKVGVNTAVPLTISVTGGQVLELRVTLEGNYPAGMESAIWGDAHLR